MKSAAERQALKRTRDALGLIECRPWLPCELVEWLISDGWITDAEAADPAALGNVITIFAIKHAAQEGKIDLVSQRDWLGRIVIPKVSE